MSKNLGVYLEEEGNTHTIYLHKFSQRIKITSKKAVCIYGSHEEKMLIARFEDFNFTFESGHKEYNLVLILNIADSYD